MKTLYILRHAKSSWDDSELEDFQRPLNSRGEKDAPKMGKLLRKEPVLPKVIVSSPANRALTTARLVAKEIDYPSLDIQEQQRLYHASEEVILEIIKTLDDSLDAVMVVGHNPGLTEFANALLDEEISNIPTAGLVGAKLNVHQWKDMRWGSGEMFLFEYPKKK